MSTDTKTSISPLRRIGATLVIAGIAAFGSVAIAPAASAAPLDGPAKVVKSDDGKGPDAFIVLEHGRVPIFFCEVDAKDAAEDAAKNIMDTAKDTAKDVKDAAKGTAKDVKRAAEDAAKDIMDAAKDAAKDIKDAAKDEKGKHANKCEDVSVDGPRF